mmetsp:Transcript_4286/g.9983  ORF Transcript_4286/g.9983 Transcript_4286/m.9983 type:complete len:516 (-) Transcript_4286:33-1580(-)
MRRRNGQRQPVLLPIRAAAALVVAALGSLSALHALHALARGVGFVAFGNQRCSMQAERRSAVLPSRLHRSLMLRAAAAGDRGASAWILPSVEKDTGEFLSGSGTGYAWVQSSATMYVFAAAPDLESSGERARKLVKLEIEEEGSMIRLVVDGKDILNGLLTHPVKPGEEIWMIEDAPDGEPYVVVELEKQNPGREWTSLMRPKVSIGGDYPRLKYARASVTDEQQELTVNATLAHLRRQLGEVSPGKVAEMGDQLLVDMQGFELQEDGSRGESLSMGTASGQKIELGEGSGFPPELHKELVGIRSNETRDVRITLGQRAGELAGQTIICAVTCRQVQVLPELDDAMAAEVKRREQVTQAATEEGLDEEDEIDPTTFTLEQLKAEIRDEVRQRTGGEEQATVRKQLEFGLVEASDVDCEFGNLGSDAALYQEKLAAIVIEVAQREGLEAMIDMEAIKKETWDMLAIPKQGQTIAEVGKDPDREFQETQTKVLRRRRLERVLDWLEQQAVETDPPSS